MICSCVCLFAISRLVFDVVAARRLCVYVFVCLFVVLCVLCALCVCVSLCLYD